MIEKKGEGEVKDKARPTDKHVKVIHTFSERTEKKKVSVQVSWSRLDALSQGCD